MVLANPHTIAARSKRGNPALGTDNQPRFGSWSRVGHPNRKDQKDFKDEKDETQVTFKVSGFATIKSIPLSGSLDTFFRQYKDQTAFCFCGRFG
jgi:hypothetical protein